MREINICAISSEKILMEFGILFRFVGQRNFCTFYSRIWMKCGMLPWPDILFKLMLNSVFVIDIQGREPYLGDVCKEHAKISLSSVVYEPISFKLGVMIDTTKLYNVTGLQESRSLCSYSVVKCHEVALTFTVVNYVRFMTVRNVSMANSDRFE